MKTFLAFIATVVISSPAAAVVIKDTYGADTGYSADELSVVLGGASEFLGVAALLNSAGTACSGALISATSVLTARHCTDDLQATDWRVYFGTNTDGFVKYDVSSVASMASDPADHYDYFNGTDLSILELSSPVTWIEPYEVLTETDYIETVAIIGYGRHGTGSTGATETIDWERRYATNTYELYGTGFDNNKTLMADFDKEDGRENIFGELGFSSEVVGTTYEGMVGPGDSGGPLLFYRDGEWVIGGVATGVRAFDGVANSDYGDIGVWTGISNDAAKDLITDADGTLYSPVDATVSQVPLPLPASLTVVALSCLQLLRVCRGRTKD